MIVPLLADADITPTLQSIVEREEYRKLDTLHRACLAKDILQSVARAVEGLRKLGVESQDNYEKVLVDTDTWTLDFITPFIAELLKSVADS